MVAVAPTTVTVAAGTTTAAGLTVPWWPMAYAAIPAASTATAAATAVQLRFIIGPEWQAHARRSIRPRQVDASGMAAPSALRCRGTNAGSAATAAARPAST